MIYAIQAGDGGAIKFGVAERPENRVRELQTGNPAKLKLLTCAELHSELECFIHYHLREDRLQGEWFRPSVKAWNMVWALERQSIYPEQHEVGNFIADNDDEALLWYRDRLNLWSKATGSREEFLERKRSKS